MFINTMKTGFLMFGLVFLFVAIGGILGNQQGALIGLLIAGGMSFYSYWFSDRMVIRAYNGQEVTPENNPRLYQLIQRLAKNANLPMPKIYIIPERQPNAFATGRNPQNAAVACTAGSIANIARFLPYVSSGNNRDGNRRRNNVGTAMLLSFLAPIAASIIQMSISRKREYMADRAGAEFSGNPLYLRNALQKLESYSQSIAMNRQEPTRAHMFIINPFSGLGNLKNLFSTHPSTDDRIRELEKMAREQHLL